MFSLFLVAVLASCVTVRPQLPTLVKTPGARPPGLLGISLKASDGLQVDANGKEQPVPPKTGAGKEFEDTGGEQSQGVGPGASLRWKLASVAARKYFLNFLCRTGHQKGYEYVSPEMTFVVDVNGRPVAVEPVTEIAAVRTYQSKDGWGHDMGWIRSSAMVALGPGDVITIGCTEKYAFVTRCVLVDEEAHRLAQVVGRCAIAAERTHEGIHRRSASRAVKTER
jgi:hypothetical protein